MRERVAHRRAGERERHSLEPLLTTPASREAIISGKILATGAFTLVSIAVTLLAYRIVFAVMPSDRIDLSLNVSFPALAKLFVVILPIVMLGATLLTALAAFARSHREAQGYLPLLIFLPMIPTLFLMVAPVRTQLWMLLAAFLVGSGAVARADDKAPAEPGAGTPKPEEPRTDAPKVETPKPETPKADVPKADGPKAEEPKKGRTAKKPMGPTGPKAARATKAPKAAKKAEAPGAADEAEQKPE